MSILEEYWSGVLRRLQAEVDTFNRLIDHQGEKGRENELSLSRVLERLVPARYGIGSGLLIDSRGNYSKQMDIVIYDISEEPALMAQTNQVLFPVENVRLCIEVKTTANKQELEDAVAKRKSVLDLFSHGRHPKFAFVGYQASQTAATLAGHLRTPNFDDRIDFACILQIGMFAAKRKFAPGVTSEDEDYVVGVTPLHQRSGRERVLGEYMRPSADDPTAFDLFHEGHSYPIVEVNGEEYACEPSRSLLLFCESMLNALAFEGALSVLSHYLTRAGRELVEIS
ncbi:DUF6602 domain-containing protein [Rhodococcus gordoniae]|uniref:DUF6602 domain-containing protein n=1 Tax=Rhodococcus gordoniae TaxID=223392 RepID=UPI0020CD9926|nr:DUF6602 domain-containing protein [Rhodococcus gordoniae]UTT48884.1 hypothetical protein NMQ04_01295 [Rhodococcus gordoniae]